jgi:hypothetical protein
VSRHEGRTAVITGAALGPLRCMNDRQVGVDPATPKRRKG